MAVYKVAQDVEADDKLLGPFTVRQFVYLIIVAMASAIAYFLGRLFLPLAIIPLPIILFFGVLALPLRKDQPMEVYFAALISYYVKPRKRFWIPDGLASLVEITAPQAIEDQRTKEFTSSEAESRLGYLASIVDTEGWAVRHAVAAPVQTNTSMIGDVYNDAQSTPDPLDTTGTIAQSFDGMLAEATEKRREDIMNHMRNPESFMQPAVQPQQPTYTDPYTALNQTAQQPSNVHFNPYPDIHQSVIQPLDKDDQVIADIPAGDFNEPVLSTPPVYQPQQIAQQPQSAPPQPVQNQNKNTSETTMSPDIIKLVNNADLSIETIAREAHRIKDKDEGEEVVISLR